MILYNAPKLVLIIALILVLSMSVLSQAETDTVNVLNPPLKGLVALKHPDLKGVEKEGS